MMNEKQIYRRMNECYESEYGNYDNEAEWYGSNDPKTWEFEIPSRQVKVQMLMEEESKRIIINERPYGKGNEYKRVGCYEWR